MSAPPKKPTPPPAAATHDPLPAAIDKLCEQDAGDGISSDFADLDRPIIRVLQTNSPQCDARGAEYIEGAEAGLFWLSGSLTPIRETLTVVPIVQLHSFMEWLAGRQGYANRHADLPPDATPDPSNPRRWVRPDGNIVEDTKEIYVLLDKGLWLLPCASTRHQFARRLMSYAQQRRHPRTDKPYPFYARRYELRTTAASNAKGHWYNVAFNDLGWTPEADYLQARALSADLKRGLLSPPPGGTPRLSAA
jgi:hypothetical protein